MFTALREWFEWGGGVSKSTSNNQVQGHLFVPFLYSFLSACNTSIHMSVSKLNLSALTTEHVNIKTESLMLLVVGMLYLYSNILENMSKVQFD